MEPSKRIRQLDSDEDYRDRVKTSATTRLKYNQPDDITSWTEAEKEAHFASFGGQPYNDAADTIAHAVLSDLRGRKGVGNELDQYDDEVVEDIFDHVSEIIRQGIAAEVYERPALDYTPFVYHDEKWPFFDDNEIRSEGGTYTPHEVRQQLFNRMIDKAMTCGQEEGNYTPTERCMRTVHGVIGLIDGKGGNRSDGKGLPVMQLMICPSPEYSEERARKGLPLYDNSVPLDCGLPAPDYETGLTRAFEDHYTSRFETSIRARQLRAAKDLFGS